MKINIVKTLLPLRKYYSCHLLKLNIGLVIKNLLKTQHLLSNTIWVGCWDYYNIFEYILFYNDVNDNQNTTDRKREKSDPGLRNCDRAKEGNLN